MKSLTELKKEKENENENQEENQIQNQNQIQNENENKIEFKDSEIINDNRYVQKLQEWINDNDFFSKMKKGFSAKRDGFNCENWHKAVDNKGKTLVVIKTKQNFIFGGFTKVGWKKNKSKSNQKDTQFYDGYINDSDAFIFSLRNNKGDRQPEKFSIKKKEAKNAIYYGLKNGPVFGGGNDIKIKSNLKSGKLNFGYTFHLPKRYNVGKQSSSELFSWFL
ncbi:hypothetical protein M0811_13253 [Anaeramoeba ignava]|uniref:TLDc domain-containing protein n=1 Tax=Anaeramoeba ignava TaxID=1746090 RepID=A0A9Q0L8P6_ANAIG|nr:hypothetical protein M0811_13253 [Anaeramoeba ignava]